MLKIIAEYQNHTVQLIAQVADMDLAEALVRGLDNAPPEKKDESGLVPYEGIMLILLDPSTRKVYLADGDNTAGSWTEYPSMADEYDKYDTIGPVRGIWSSHVK